MCPSAEEIVGVSNVWVLPAALLMHPLGGGGNKLFDYVVLWLV